MFCWPPALHGATTIAWNIGRTKSEHCWNKFDRLCSANGTTDQRSSNARTVRTADRKPEAIRHADGRDRATMRLQCAKHLSHRQWRNRFAVLHARQQTHRTASAAGDQVTHIASLLRKLLKFDGMTIAEIARQTNCHHSMLDRILRGQRFSEPPSDLAMKLQTLLAERTRASH